MDERALTSEPEQKRENDSVAQIHKLLENLEELDAKTRRILKLLEGSAAGIDSRGGSSGLSELGTLLSIPDHLRQTLVVAQKLGMTTSEDVAEQTGRAKSLESSYLNQLARASLLKKQRLGRKVYFSLK